MSISLEKLLDAPMKIIFKNNHRLIDNPPNVCYNKAITEM